MGTRIDAIKNNEITDTNFYEYWNQCRALNYAAEANYQLFLDSTKQPFSVERELKQIGFFNSALLLRAVAIENLIKSRILFEMKNDGSIKKYNSINEIINNKWGRKNSHNPIALCKKHDIALNDKETDFIQNHLDHMDWAGRFPFPKNTSNIKSKQVLGGNQAEIMKKLILRFSMEMNLDLDCL